LTNLMTGLVNQLEKLPLIGHDLNLTVSNGFIGELNTDFLTPLINNLTPNVDPNTVNTVITNAINQLASAVPGMVKAHNVTVDTQNGTVSATMEVGNTDTYGTSFNANLGGLGLDVTTTGGVQLSLKYDLHLGFELSKTQGFLFLRSPDSNNNDFTFQVSAGLAPNTTLQAKLFFLEVKATNETTTGPGTGLNASLGISLGATGTPTLTASQLAASAFTADYTAAASPTLTCTLSRTWPIIPPCRR
jgi:hypothetical protein